MTGAAQKARVLVFDGEEPLARFAAQTWDRIAEEALAERGRFAAALSGGRTPVGFYRALAGGERTVSWEAVHLFQVDERFVPPADRDSNYGLIQTCLLQGISIPTGNVHPIRTDLPTPAAAAVRYEEELLRHFRPETKQIPRFDFVLLGMGKDGHTASLFPESSSLHDKQHLVLAVRPAAALHDRITLALTIINSARSIVFMVTGKEKAAALRKVVEENDPALPASLIEPADGDLTFLLDREAAALLPPDVFQKGETIHSLRGK